MCNPWGYCKTNGRDPKLCKSCEEIGVRKVRKLTGFNTSDEIGSSEIAILLKPLYSTPESVAKTLSEKYERWTGGRGESCLVIRKK